MCGIIGIWHHSAPAQDDLLAALRRMEYRGYDSAGICTLTAQRELACVRAVGKLDRLEAALAARPCPGRIGIGHTRWATHGAPSVENAHPHRAGRVALVHNGIIENHARIREALAQKGAEFRSETDTEAVAHLFDQRLHEARSLSEAWEAALYELRGAYALCALVEGEEVLLFARRGSPLLLGRSGRGWYVASDALALAGLADEVCYLEDGDWGWIDAEGVHLRTAEGANKSPQWRVIPEITEAGGKGGYAYYMEKEIDEQPEVLARILDRYLEGDRIVWP
ncbi:MAG: glutamine--fructose-6-phosphate transaminase (isomerizing), partial [Zetaproteobacteria bacterium]